LNRNPVLKVDPVRLFGEHSTNTSTGHCVLLVYFPHENDATHTNTSFKSLGANDAGCIITKL
jgi:hypothetical protein